METKNKRTAVWVSFLKPTKYKAAIFAGTFVSWWRFFFAFIFHTGWVGDESSRTSLAYISGAVLPLWGSSFKIPKTLTTSFPWGQKLRKIMQMGSWNRFRPKLSLLAAFSMALQDTWTWWDLIVQLGQWGTRIEPAAARWSRHRKSWARPCSPPSVEEKRNPLKDKCRLLWAFVSCEQEVAGFQVLCWYCGAWIFYGNSVRTPKTGQFQVAL